MAKGVGVSVAEKIARVLQVECRTADKTADMLADVIAEVAESLGVDPVELTEDVLNRFEEDHPEDADRDEEEY